MTEHSDEPATAAGFRLQVSIDCTDPAAMTTFWNLALGYVEQPPPPGFDSWDAVADSPRQAEEKRTGTGSSVDPAGVGPRLLFHRVPERKVVKNRLHFDVTVGAGSSGEDRKAAVRSHAQRLVQAGATITGERSDEFSWWIVLTDIEGNEFCLQ